MRALWPHVRNCCSLIGCIGSCCFGQVALDYRSRADVVQKKRDLCNITEVVSMNKCDKCGSQNLNNWEKQTRSADEPMTQFFQCLNCGHQWRDQ
jgi:DNA-directed RNA polymerase subunit M/transcription elongation factor TFIIS